MTAAVEPLEAAVLEHQGHLLEMMASGTAPDRILEQLVESLESLLPGGRCSILLVDDGGTRLRHGAAPNLPEPYCAAIDGIAIAPGTGSCGSAAHLGRLVVARDTQSDPYWTDFRSLAREHGLRACWSSPIMDPDSVVLGTFAVYHAEPHEPTGREVDLLERFSALAAVAIRHATMFRALADSEERFRRSFEDNAAGMALVDFDGALVRVNPAFCTAVGRDAAALRGERFATLLLPDSRPAAAHALAQLAGEGRDGIQLEVGLQRPDGSAASALLALSLVRASDGAPRHGCISLIDDTERRRAEAERQAAEAAQAAAEQRSLASGQLLSAMSHELRTPMSAIVGFLELLRSVDLPPDRREHAVAHLAEASEHMLELVDDLLNLAKLEAGAADVRATR